MSNCPYCGKKIPMSKAFCSKSCKENYFQMLAIQIPQPFLKRIFIFCTLEQREIEIENFAKRHYWNHELVKKKIEEESIKFGYENN
ncbi:hypothetical protein AVENP_0622 [Arcobacter venerupis]|uniref:DUF2116 family Zn-ribbon domain-containing protein n=1 Tax=Arcobacter venerupis TaxID=1054033 RepID=A0AAE7B956_9BACT|nr:DUF2116 family Zn-ribbon domain-containing protein [Arcobacter venerupis]QKF66195.1 hypothetical protein AVENP_0622 [Arcobacter venerupis]RWS51018.1 hypothetical protein CKA56_01435 [Arcobacter venerupis]